MFHCATLVLSSQPPSMTGQTPKPLNWADSRVRASVLFTLRSLKTPIHICCQSPFNSATVCRCPAASASAASRTFEILLKISEKSPRLPSSDASVPTVFQARRGHLPLCRASGRRPPTGASASYFGGPAGPTWRREGGPRLCPARPPGCPEGKPAWRVSARRKQVSGERRRSSSSSSSSALHRYFFPFV